MKYFVRAKFTFVQKQVYNSHSALFTDGFSTSVDVTNFCLTDGLFSLHLYDVGRFPSAELYFSSLFLTFQRRISTLLSVLVFFLP